jgi:arginase
MKNKIIRIVGAPVDEGGAQRGCLMGPDALRVAGLREALSEQGYAVEDHGNLRLESLPSVAHGNPAIHHLAECAAWIDCLTRSAFEASERDRIAVFLGGDHLMSAGTVAGMALRARQEGREQFVLWLDAHTDFHSLETTTSGNLHGTPVAYFTGQPGFGHGFPPVEAPVPPRNILMLGIRSVDPAERVRITEAGLPIADMRMIDEEGIARPLSEFLAGVKAANGRLHVSFDVDFVEPSIAPAVGTTVPGGATFREAHLVMEMLHDSGLVTSLDVAELNPFLDERGRTARLVVDLVASLFGKRVMDRPNRSH